MATIRGPQETSPELSKFRRFIKPFSALEDPSYRWLWTGQLATILQLIAPEAMRGRVVSTRAFVFGLAPFGLIPMTALAQVTSAPFAVGVGAALFACALILLLLRIPQIRSFSTT